MAQNKINLKELSKLLSRFFDAAIDIPEKILFMSGEFIFHEAKFTELHKYPDLFETLQYLKNVKERNHFADLNDLVQYYEKKQRMIDVLFDRFEEAEAEERFALNFEGVCKTFLEGERSVETKSSFRLYYPMTTECNNVVEFGNISYGDSEELEKQHLAQIKGNMLIKQQNVSSVTSKKIDPHVAN